MAKSACTKPTEDLRVQRHEAIWLDGRVPNGYWDRPENRRLYVRWLGRQLGIRRPADWYRVTVQDFKDHKGGAFLIHYNSTVSAAIKAFLPDYDWKEWMFHMAPLGFWQERKNRRRYMLWLGKELGFEKIDDWYSVTGSDFVANYGNQCLKIYGGSPIAALRDCFPRHTWHEWMFARVPVDFWNSKENRQRYLRWLGKRLGFRKPEDWSRVRRDDFRTNHGASLLARYRSYHDLVKECAPGA